MTGKLLCTIIFLGGSIFLTGCSSTDSGTSSNEGSGKGGGSCLEGFAERLDELLTPEIATSVGGIEAEEAKYDYSKVMKDPYYHSVSYSWKSSTRTKSVTVGAQTMEFPASDRVELKGIKKTSKEAFQRSVYNPTDEELAEANKRMKEALSGESDNEAVNKRLEKLKEMGVDPETILGMGTEIAGAAGKVAQRFSEVKGVGDLAAWNSAGERLHVWADGTEFSVSVILGDDDDVNREKSVALAKEILKNCR